VQMRDPVAVVLPALLICVVAQSSVFSVIAPGDRSFLARSSPMKRCSFPIVLASARSPAQLIDVAVIKIV
ncbi:hypothetical protein P692DRAFT_20836187, partial [Suillus brevipes Sb2]